MSLADYMAQLAPTVHFMDILSTVSSNKVMMCISSRFMRNARILRPVCSLAARPVQLARMHCGAATVTARLAMPSIHHATLVRLVALVSMAV